MRQVSLFILCATAAFAAQPFSIGVKGGIPINDFVNGTNTASGVLHSTVNRYIVGPELELNLPWGFGVEFDAMYRHYNFQGFGVSGTATTTTSTGAWEFPLLAKWRVPIPVVHPYIAGGVSWDHLTGTGVTASSVFPGQLSGPGVDNNTVFGYVGGVGVEFQAKRLRIEPEIRYTRWGSQHFISSNGISTGGVTSGSAFSSNQNQLELLLGFTFGGGAR
jgi:opacity protein-like surface antigen